MKNPDAEKTTEKDSAIPENSIDPIDQYIRRFPENSRKMLMRMREIIKSEAPDAVEKISYQMPTFFLNGNLVHFAAFKNHIGFYPLPHVIASFKAELACYKTGKGSIQFPLDEPLPEELIRQIVRQRIRDNLNKGTKTG